MLGSKNSGANIIIVPVQLYHKFDQKSTFTLWEALANAIANIAHKEIEPTILFGDEKITAQLKFDEAAAA